VAVSRRQLKREGRKRETRAGQYGAVDATVTSSTAYPNRNRGHHAHGHRARPPGFEGTPAVAYDV